MDRGGARKKTFQEQRVIHNSSSSFNLYNNLYVSYPQKSKTKHCNQEGFVTGWEFRVHERQT